MWFVIREKSEITVKRDRLGQERYQREVMKMREIEGIR
jgi:hypothetical protein